MQRNLSKEDGTKKDRCIIVLFTSVVKKNKVITNCLAPYNCFIYNYIWTLKKVNMYKEGDFITVDCDSLLKIEYFNLPIFKINKIDNLNRKITIESKIGCEVIFEKENILPIEIGSNLSKKVELDYVLALRPIFDLNSEKSTIVNKQEYFKDTLEKFLYSDSIEPINISKCKYVHEVQEVLRNRPELNVKLKYV